MLRSTLRRVRAALHRAPLTRGLYAALKDHWLLRMPYRGDAAALARRLEALQLVAGRDRLPPRVATARLAGWLAALNRHAVPDAGPPRRILFFTVMAHWVDFCLPVAIALAGRGCAVDFVWSPFMDMSRREPDDDRPVDSSRCPAGCRPHPRLGLYNVFHLPPCETTEEMRAIVQRCSVTDTAYSLYRETVDVAAEPAAAALFALRQQRNLFCLRALRGLLRRRHYDQVLTPNGGILEFRMAFEAARLEGVPAVTMEMSDRKERIIAASGRTCTDPDTDPAWQADAPHVLTPERERRLAERMRLREAPDWKQGEYTWHGQRAAVAERPELAALGLDPTRPTALLCTNIAWDTAALDRARVFPSMAEWIVQTVAWFIERPDWQLVVRVHPGEATWPNNEPVEPMLAARFPHLPGHVRVVGPRENVNTYGLMRSVRLGLVYTSTAGMEMATRGLPVVTAGHIHYAGRGFTSDPVGAASYFAELRRLTTDPAPLPARPVELAKCYADVYFEDVPRPFPWWDYENISTLTDAWPVADVLAGRCPPEFLRTFDYLAGRAVG